MIAQEQLLSQLDELKSFVISCDLSFSASLGAQFSVAQTHAEVGNNFEISFTGEFGGSRSDPSGRSFDAEVGPISSSALEQRLRESHAQWHSAEQNYSRAVRAVIETAQRCQDEQIQAVNDIEVEIALVRSDIGESIFSSVTDARHVWDVIQGLGTIALEAGHKVLERVGRGLERSSEICEGRNARWEAEISQMCVEVRACECGSDEGMVPEYTIESESITPEYTGSTIDPDQGFNKFEDPEASKTIPAEVIIDHQQSEEENSSLALATEDVGEDPVSSVEYTEGPQEDALNQDWKPRIWSTRSL